MKPVLLVSLLLTFAAAEEYAVLVAGSNGFWNYRHQADVCHAYQVLISHGFNPDNIILFSYDDVPTDALNPFPGQLFNRPGNDSQDVNAGCIKDYTGESVNATNFLATITGNAAGVKGGNGKVLKSGPNDNVFINFVDHGAPGFVAFPSTYLYADQLNSSLTYMYTHNMYKNLVFYLEACESGSMFDGILSPNIEVYATTAANPNESSWGTYCPPDDFINGTELYTCLGDLYSVNWMEDSDQADFSIETLQQQFQRVKVLTTLSEVLEYGNVTISSKTLSQFLGPKAKEGEVYPAVESVAWDSYDVKLKYLYYRFVMWPDDDNSKALMGEMVFRQNIQQTFEIISQLLDPDGEEELLTGYTPVTDFPCLRASIEIYEMQCGSLGTYGMQYAQVLVNACEGGHSIAEMNGAFSQACTGPDPDELAPSEVMAEGFF